MAEAAEVEWQLAQFSSLRSSRPAAAGAVLSSAPKRSKPATTGRAAQVAGANNSIPRQARGEQTNLGIGKRPSAVGANEGEEPLPPVSSSKRRGGGREVVLTRSGGNQHVPV